ncbi:hypothetical protein ABEW34_28065 [Paenibacillus algorifonticola]
MAHSAAIGRGRRPVYFVPEANERMHQSRKEQGLERISRKLLHADRHEAIRLSQLEEDMEAAEEWAGFPSAAGKRSDLKDT